MKAPQYISEIVIYDCEDDYYYEPERVCLACSVAGCDCDESISGCDSD